MPKPAKAPAPMTKITFKRSNYWRPTPRVWREIGDVCLILSASAQAVPLFMEVGWYATLASVLLLAGKIATNFAARTNAGTYEP